MRCINRAGFSVNVFKLLFSYVGCKVCLGVFGGLKLLAKKGRISRNYARRTLSVFSVVLLIFGLLVSLLGAAMLARATAGTDEKRVYVGIDVAYDNEEAVYRLVNEVKGYVNLIILGSLNITTDTAKLTRVCDYLYQQGMYFIVYVGFGLGTPFPPRGPALQFFSAGIKRWGDKLLGAYVFDEAGGKTVDNDHPTQPYQNYTDAAEQFVYHTHYYLANYTYYYNDPALKLVTSDYALYWYDYLLGYDVVFGEFVGNQSRQLAIALNRGAANTMGKDWGTMITWKYTQPPFVEEPLQLLSDMVAAYNNGAKYIIVFNGLGNHTATTRYGILTPEHLAMMKLFWLYTQFTHTPEEFPAETAYVLPKDYGYGFRGPADRIWGYFPPDNLSPLVWNASNRLIQKYGTKLDIVYGTKLDNNPLILPYERLIYWNGTTINKSGPD